MNGERAATIAILVILALFVVVALAALVRGA